MHGSLDPPPPDPVAVTRAVRALCAGWIAEGPGDEGYPAARIAALARAGALAAYATLDAPGAVTALRDALRAVGAADLALGRLFEGHVNAVQLVHAYGDPRQRAMLARDMAAGALHGVWNTEPEPGLRLARGGGARRLEGAKIFATGAGRLDRALVTARDGDGAKRMVLADIAGMAARADNGGWRVRGMRGTISGRFDFTGLAVPDAALIGGAGDYEREPRFSGGAWRFCAVQLGAVEALVRLLRDRLRASGKAADPIHRARFAGCVAATRSAGLWVAQAARRAEAGAAGAVPLVLMTRGIVEDAGHLAMEACARGVGTAAFFDGDPIDRLTRDLGLYLRQPAPDQARDRAAEAWLEADRWGEDGWW